MEGRTMNDEKKCLRCGSSNLSPSEVQSTGKIYSRPREAKLVTLLTTGVPVSANICLDCGHVELVVNADKAKSIAKVS
jgi:predicted nucleic-acid-binding Zn-ribbon protein